MLIRYCAGFLSVILSVTPACGAGADPFFRIVAVEEATGIELGRGIDIITNAPRQDCVVRDTTTPASSGQDAIQFDSTELTSLFELNESLGVSASAKFGGGGFGGSASASFSHSLAFQRFSLFYHVRSALTSKGAGLRDVHLKEEFAALLTKGTPEALQRFRALCGDGYIGEVVTGGEFQAVVKIDTSSRQERDNISASISGSMSFASGSASFQSAVETNTKNSSVHVFTYRRGGTGQSIAITLADIAKQASDIPSIAAQQGGVPLRLGVWSYVTVISDPAVSFADFASRDKQLRALSELNDRLFQRRSEIDFIVNHPDSFFLGAFDLPDLAAENTTLGELLDKVVERANSCIAAAGECAIDDLTPPDILIQPGQK